MENFIKNSTSLKIWLGIVLLLIISSWSVFLQAKERQMFGTTIWEGSLLTDPSSILNSNLRSESWLKIIAKNSKTWNCRKLNISINKMWMIKPTFWIVFLMLLMEFLLTTSPIFLSGCLLFSLTKSKPETLLRLKSKADLCHFSSTLKI